MRTERSQSTDTDVLSTVRSELADRVRARTPEIEREFVARLRALGDDDRSSEFLTNLQAATRESIQHAMDAVEKGEDWTPEVPPAVAAQIRVLANGGATLEEMLNGYSIVHALLMEFLTEEMGVIPPEALGPMLKVHSQQSDKLMMAFTAEYTNEVERLNRSAAERLTGKVQRLIAGSTADVDGLDYELDAWHLGLIALGTAGELAVRRMAEELGCGLLLVSRSPETIWAWLGARRGIAIAEFAKLASSKADSPVRFALGEPRQGIEGWRQTHREAQIALTVMLRGRRSLVRCADVVLAAAVMREETMSGSLIDAYLGPLDELRDAEVLRQTLRSYLGADCNAASTAASLGVDRHTVQRRLRRIEERLERPLQSCRAELEVALQVETLQT